MKREQVSIRKYFEEVRKSPVKLFQFIVSVSLYFLSSIAIHEYSHFILLILLGGEGYIRWNYTVVQRLPSSPLSILAIASGGGLLTSLFFGILYKYEEDPEDLISFLVIVLTQFIYGIAEGIYYLVFLRIGVC